MSSCALITVLIALAVAVSLLEALAADKLPRSGELLDAERVTSRGAWWSYGQGTR